MFANINCK